MLPFSPSSVGRVCPESAYLRSLDCWTHDPAAAVLLQAIRALLPVGDTLRALSAERPAIDRLIADEIGALCDVTIETGRLNVVERDVRPSGVIASLWNELDALRGRWISARLADEGLNATVPDIGPWYDRLRELEQAAPALPDYWCARRG